MPRLQLSFFILISFVVLSCSSKEAVYENMYEGLKHREEIIHPSQDALPKETPSYDEYKREREEALKES